MREVSALGFVLQGLIAIECLPIGAPQIEEVPTRWKRWLMAQKTQMHRVDPGFGQQLIKPQHCGQALNIEPYTYYR